MPIEIQEKVSTNSKKVVGTQIPQELYERLKIEADRDFMSVSDLLRKIIFFYYRDIDAKENN